MPIQFRCAHCGIQTEVSDEYGGQTGPCAGCGQTITVAVSRAAPAPAGLPKKSNTSTVVIIVVAVCAIPVLLACVGILVALLLPAIQASREAARRAACNNHLRQIGMALQAYHDEHGSFPPAYLADEDGTATHSWRVLILPYLGEQPLYDMYDFDEPWDGPNNSLLVDMMPEVYRCPDEVSNIDESDTSYAMIVGESTISDGPTAKSAAQILDGMSNTILVVETAGSGINWLKPEDLDATLMNFTVNDGNPEEINSDHAGVANVLMCDGSTHAISSSIDPRVLEALVTIDDGQAVTIP